MFFIFDTYTFTVGQKFLKFFLVFFLFFRFYKFQINLVNFMIKHTAVMSLDVFSLFFD